MMPSLPAALPVTEYALTAEALGVNPVMIHALGHIESLGNPLAIRCENHWWRKVRFASREAKAFDNLPNAKGMDERWARFWKMDAVCAADAPLNPRARVAAVLCHSFCWSQLMGFNHKICGFEDAMSWFAAVQTLDGQRECTIAFIRENPVLLEAFRKRNFAVIAHHYNGPQYAKNKYDTKLARRVAELEKDRPAYA